MSGGGDERGVVRGILRRRGGMAALAGGAPLGAHPRLAGGQAVARAVDDGFLAGHPATGLAWLAALAGTVPLGAFGARRTYLGVAQLVEPLRDDLVHRVVDGALRSTTGDGNAGA